MDQNLQTKFDLCVIGSGPAGIIAVLEYVRVNPDKTVLLVEYGFPGQKVKNDLDDSIVVDNLVNHHDPYECTNKGLGGTSLTWGGRCVMYDEIDFLKDRPIINGECTWDVSLFEEVKKHLDATAKYFECGEPVFNLNEIPQFKGSRIAENFKEGVVTDSLLERWSMPTRFGSRYRKALEDCKNITLMEGYEARDFSEPDAEGKVSSLTIRNVRNGETTSVGASNFVLAAGTQESTRILLRNTQLFKNLGFTPPALGKYYQGHVFGKIAGVKFYGDPKKTDYGYLRNPDGTYIRRRFHFTQEFMLKNDLLNTILWIDNPLYHDYRHKNGAMSFMYLAMITPILKNMLAPPAIAHSITKGETKTVGKHIWNFVKDLPMSMITPALIFSKRYLVKRKLPGVFLYNPMNEYSLSFHAEQFPSAQNRMELDKDGETLNIHYDLTDADVNSAIKVHDELDKYLREINCGEVVYWYPKEDLAEAVRNVSKDGIHQIGTTRIADTPEEGVLDKDLKLYGTSNVYVCSSSAFPTSGHANPTFFLGAFAVRLANFLK